MSAENLDVSCRVSAGHATHITLFKNWLTETWKLLLSYYLLRSFLKLRTKIKEFHCCCWKKCQINWVHPGAAWTSATPPSCWRRGKLRHQTVGDKRCFFCATGGCWGACGTPTPSPPICCSPTWCACPSSSKWHSILSSTGKKSGIRFFFFHFSNGIHGRKEKKEYKNSLKSAKSYTYLHTYWIN